MPKESKANFYECQEPDCGTVFRATIIDYVDGNGEVEYCASCGSDNIKKIDD